MDKELRSAERRRIGFLVRCIRLSKGLDLKELALLTGIDASNLSRIERGKYGVGIDILNRICCSLGYKVVILPDYF